MAGAAFIAGDWGTSHLRLSLCSADGAPLATRLGRGVGSLSGAVAAEFESLTAEWTQEHGRVPAVLCGMAGSTLGWREAPYLPCPVHVGRIGNNMVRFMEQGRDIAIAPGVSCRNRYVGPDVMRGEETQILGAMRCMPALATGRHILCMPGTHAKWVTLQDGTIEMFLTGITGELFDIVCRHSILVGAKGPVETADGAEFNRALEQVRLHPDAELIHLLFGTRSRQLTGELKAKDAASYLSGLIIGRDVAGALRLFKSDLAQAKAITVVATPDLSALYASALKSRNVAVNTVDGHAASLAGLTALFESLSGAGLARAN